MIHPCCHLPASAGNHFCLSRTQKIIPPFGLLGCAALLGLVLVAIPSSSLGQNSESAPNLLPNPSFEQTRITVEGWQTQAWHGGDAAFWAVESPGRSGQHCLTIRSEKGSDAAWIASIAVKTNTLYELSGWIRTRNIRGAVGALLNIQGLQDARTAAVTGTRDWTHVSTIFSSANSTSLQINCLFGGWGESTGQAWFDDVALVPVTIRQGALSATITIDPGARSLPYDRKIFGGFIEHFGRQVYGGLYEPGSPLSDARGFRKDVIAALKELKLSVVRWPGGCFASGYHWTNGVGRTRTPVPDPVWGDTDPNTFGTDEFIEWCRLVGCEPYICANAGNGTPEEMRQWVEYCNGSRGEYAAMRRADGHAQPFNVHFWSVGNENWGDWEIGAKTPEVWGPFVRRAAELMLKVDPTLDLAAAATPDRGWTLPLLKAAGPYLHYVTVHQYWIPGWGKNEKQDYLSCILHSQSPEQTIQTEISILEESGFRGKIKIAFDEWNLRGWHHPGFPRKQTVAPGDQQAAALIKEREQNAIASRYTMADALFSASFLNACLRHCEDVGMANISPIINTRGPLYVYPGGIVRRTTFHTLAMYANLLESRVGKLDLRADPLVHGSDVIPVVDAIATVDESGRHWAIALVNRHPEEAVACTLKLGKQPIVGQVKTTVLAGDSPDAYNDVEHPDRVVPRTTQLSIDDGVVKLPPHSLSILQVTIKDQN